ncbi:MAG: hypothetical protein WCG01_05525 [bacterium]
MSIKFSRELIKGRIAEVVFEEMIRSEGRYTTIPFGYEHTVPSLAQYQHLARIKEVMNNISDAPDFALISEDKSEVYLVEVKYRSNIDKDELRLTATKLLDRWNPSWIFIATNEGFYCGTSSTISKNGVINKLSTNWVSASRQEEFLKLLCEFEKK